MVSGIQGLRRLEVRDEHGVASALVIGYTDSLNLIVGIAPQRGETLMVEVDAKEAGQAFRLMRGALLGELP